MQIEYNKLYTEEMDLSSIPGKMGEAIRDMFFKGQVRGFSAESVVKFYLPGIFEMVDTKGYDAIELSTGKLIEIRTLGVTGANFASSSNRGVGRKINLEKFNTEAPTKDFLIGRVTYDGHKVIYEFVRFEGKYIAELGPTLSKGVANQLIDSFKSEGTGQMVLEFEDAE